MYLGTDRLAPINPLALNMAVQLFIDLHPFFTPSDRARVIFKERVNTVAYIKADNKVCRIPAMSRLPGTAPQAGPANTRHNNTI